MSDYESSRKKVLKGSGKGARKHGGSGRQKHGCSVLYTCHGYKRHARYGKMVKKNSNLLKWRFDIKACLSGIFCSIKSFCQNSVKSSEEYIQHLYKRVPELFSGLKIKKNDPRITKALTFCVGMTVVIVLLGIGTRAYEFSIDGEVMGFVKDKALVSDRIEQIIADNEKQYNVNIHIPSRVSFKKVLFHFGNNLSESQVVNILDSNLSVKANAFSINVNGMDIAYLKDRESAETVLNRLKEPYLKSGVSEKDIDFLEDVKIIEREIMAINIEDADNVYKRLAEGSQGVKKYVVQAGDTIWDIAQHYNVKIDDIKKANPGLNIDRIQIGQQINLAVPRYAINVTEKKITTYEEKIPYEVKYENTDTLYQGQEQVKVSGSEGKKRVKAEVVYVNGIAEKTVVLQEEVLQTPKPQVVLKGTKQRPSTLAYGVFIRPSGGAVTSRYGMRWGSMHTGVDLGAAYGDPIKAADGGKVIFAGWEGAYGQLIKIDHENGFVTYYGHCSKLYVKAGDRVARGEVIGAVGTTGRVTGPHLHFEVRKNGVPVNPMDYIK